MKRWFKLLSSAAVIVAAPLVANTSVAQEQATARPAIRQTAARESGPPLQKYFEADTDNDAVALASYDAADDEALAESPAAFIHMESSTSSVAEQALSVEQQLNDLRNEFSLFKSAQAKPKLPSVEVHGVFQADTGFFSQSPANIASVGDIQDGSSFRRARLSANGSVAPNMNYFLQMDFAFIGRPTFTDLWFEVTDVPVFGNVRVGQWKQPFSLEVVSSFRYTTFAERALTFQAFVPFRHMAIGFYDWSEDQRMTWAASVYRTGQDQYGGSMTDNGGYAGVGRMTMLPWWDECSDGSRYLHLGGAYNFVAPNDHGARFRTIPEYFVGQQVGLAPAGTSGVAEPGKLDGTPFFVDTTPIAIDHYHLVGTEALWVEGPLSVQSEFMFLFGEQRNGQSLYLPGFYAQAGYFLTGEHRPYNRKQGAIDRIKILHPLGRSGSDSCEWGWGGWETAARWSYVDLNDNGIKGGRLTDVTLGLNWYLNSYSKLQLNYIHAMLANATHGHSAADIIGLRAQVDF